MKYDCLLPGQLLGFTAGYSSALLNALTFAIQQFREWRWWGQELIPWIKAEGAPSVWKC